MKKYVVLAALMLAVTVPAADAHYSGGWYWAVSYAERKIEVRYSDVLSADCEPWGRAYRRRLYKHFDCFVDIADEETGEVYSDEVEMHVTGRRGFKLIF